MYRLQYLSHLLKHLSHYVISNIGSCIMDLQINTALNIGQEAKKYTPGKVRVIKSVEKAWHEKSSVPVKWFNEIWQVLLYPCSNWKNLKCMSRQQHNAGASSRPASYPGHKKFDLKIGIVSSCYWDSKSISVGNSKSDSRTSFQTKSATNFCPEVCHCPYYWGSCTSKVWAMQELTVCAACVNCCWLTLSSSWIPDWAKVHGDWCLCLINYLSRAEHWKNLGHYEAVYIGTHPWATLNQGRGGTHLYNPLGMCRPKGYGSCAVLVWKQV